MFLLAGHLGRTVEELGAMSWLEYQAWQASYGVQPFGLADAAISSLGKGKDMIRDPDKIMAALMTRANRG